MKKENDFCINVYPRNSGVTGSSYLNSVYFPNGENIQFLVDAGAVQGNDDDGYYNSFFPFNTEKLKFIIITHGHYDHQGLLPVAIRQGFNGNIYTSYATSKLMNVSLYDCCKIFEPETCMPVATRNEVEKTLDLVVGCSMKKIIKPHKNIKIVFYSNGHIVGAVVTLIVISYPGRDDINVIYTGDYKSNNIFFNVDDIPEKVKNMNISAIFCESTYGNIDSTDSKFRHCLADNTSKALKEGKTVIFPTFAQGRCQEALYCIKNWKNNSIIPENTPIFLDGKSSQNFTKSYMYDDLGINKNMKDFMPKNVYFVHYNSRLAVMKNPNPKIILSSGGMASYGAIQHYISRYLPREDALIHLLGYCSPNSKATKLFNTKVGEEIEYNGKNYIKKCDVLRTFELSSHAKKDELLNFINSFSNVKSIIINHGENRIKETFREYLLENLDIEEEKIAVANSENVFHIESSGITNIFQTHFKSIF